MSILFMDNFSCYGSGVTGVSKMKEGLYAETINDVALISDPDGVSSGYVLALADSAEEFIRKVIAEGTQTTLGVHIRIWFNELPISNGKKIIYFNNSANSENCSLQVDSTGIMKFVVGSTTIGITTIPVITAKAWHHIECKVVFGSSGSAELRVNGTTVINATSVDTENTATPGCAQIKLSNGSNTSLYMKDFILWNDAGSVNNDFMGDWKVVTLVPDSDVSMPWTPSTGSTGWNLIDETTPLDTDYISADATPPAEAEVTLTNLDPDVVRVAGVMTLSRALKTDSGAGQMQIGIKVNGDVDLGQDRAITTAATYWVDVSELSPDTGVAYTPIEVNDATLTIDRTL